MDAVDLGDLERMIAGLRAMGADDETPVFLWFEDDFAHLETVEVEDPEPRVVDSLGPDERDAEWLDCSYIRWRWNPGIGKPRHGDGWEFRGTFDWLASCPIGSGPFTEVPPL